MRDTHEWLKPAKESKPRSAKKEPEKKPEPQAEKATSAEEVAERLMNLQTPEQREKVLENVLASEKRQWMILFAYCLQMCP